MGLGFALDLEGDLSILDDGLNAGAYSFRRTTDLFAVSRRLDGNNG